MTTCLKVTRLVSDASERLLAPEERREVEQHFEICPACRRCAEQFSLLHRVMKRLQEAKLDS